MRPIRLFLLLLVFIAIFTGLHYLAPYPRLFPPLDEYIPAISSLNEKNEDVSSSVSPVIQTIPADSLPAYDYSTLNISPDSTVTFPEEPGPLALFMDSLMTPGRQTRIIYYGDSQIEGDRMTSYLRMALREISGGTGPGLFLPVMPIMQTKTATIRSSPNWKRYNYLSYRNGEISHLKFGPFMTVCRYLPENKPAASPVKAWVRIRPARGADSTTAIYENLRLFYRNSEGPVSVIVKAGDKEVLNDSLGRGDGVRELSCRLPGSGEVAVEFTGRVSPDIYGISIEGENGLVIDNIPQRGSAGLEFTMVDKANLEESFRLLDPDLIILQYGLNVVRSVRKDYSYYQKGVALQLDHLKTILPGTPVILLGLTDMASRVGDSIRLYKNIPSILEAQRKASAVSDAIFWDAWQVMGGNYSIVRWAEKTPPLAQPDLVHLTYEGADTLSRMMVDSLFLAGLQEDDDPAAPPAVPDTIMVDTIAAVAAVPITSDSIATVAARQNMFKTTVEQIFEYDPDRPLIFPTAGFWLFLLVVLAGYSLVYKKLVLRNFYLFLASLFFYYKSGGLFLFLLIFVTIIDYSCGIAIGRSEKKAVRKTFIVLSVLSNIGILAYFKYTEFFVDALNYVLGTDIAAHDYLAGLSNGILGTSFGIEHIILPVGISFFTFQSLSYTIDIYRRKLEPVRNILDFGFYVSFFPQLVAGPIVRASEFIPQLYVRYNLERREFSHALFMIINGLVKKVVISDFLAVNFIDRVFASPAHFSGFENLMAVYGYGIQIYCDFSGYTDIAIGVGLLLGFRLPVNFNSPYKADGMSDFWRRWHISLSRWLKDYLYIPLGGNRKGAFRTNLNLLLTMLLGGLWHGANIRFIIWGFLHGIGLIFTRMFRQFSGTRFSKSRLRKAVSVFLTFNFVSFCWIFFRAADMETVHTMLLQMTGSFSPGAWSSVFTAYSSVFSLMAAAYLLHFLPDNIKEWGRGAFIRVPVAAQLAFTMLVAVLLWQMNATETMPFIYFRF